ncbi:unnamed protein product, partial [Ectocarpus sp. 13 AM-2016]
LVVLGCDPLPKVLILATYVKTTTATYWKKREHVLEVLGLQHQHRYRGTFRVFLAVMTSDDMRCMRAHVPTIHTTLAYMHVQQEPASVSARQVFPRSPEEAKLV